MTRGQSIASAPDSLRDFARKRVTELAGLLLLLFCGALALALATWSTRDPSINHATDLSVRNWLGSPGAVVADLIMQTVGVGAAPALLPIAAFGLRLIGRRRFDRPFWRLLLWILGVFCSATARRCCRSPTVGRFQRVLAVWWAMRCSRSEDGWSAARSDRSWLALLRFSEPSFV